MTIRNYTIAGTIAAMMLLLAAAGVSAGNSITQEGDVIRLRAGVIEKTIRISGGAVLSDSLTVAGTPLLDAKSEELSFQISRAAPNRNPLELHSDSGAAALSVAEAKAGGTDALAVNAGGKSDPKGAAPGVKWVDVRSFSASLWAPCFELSKVTAFSPKPGVQRLQIRTRGLKDPVLAGVSINQIYETYDGFPVIRKWVEIHNNGANWLKLDNLRIDGMQLKPEICNQTMLTPSERDAVASVIAFSHTDKTKGVIVASEVPSALRDIDAGGASGYNAEHFEWVLGPAEGFTSEPVFIYGFAGEVRKTPSAESLPMDRTVEDGFKQFLREQLGISPDHLQIPAPLWCSWSNFGSKLTEAIVREQADIAAKCGFAVMQLDDGWQKGRLGTTPDPKTFTDFRATCDYILSKGLRIGLWVSTFRDPDAPDFQTLPDAASAPAVTRLGGVAMSFASAWRQYYARDLASLRDIYDVTYFKQDFTNIRFGDLAAGHDSRTRKESLLRGLRGLLESQALLRRLAPDVANEITHEIYWGTPGTPCDLAALKNASLYHVPPNDYSGCGHAKERPGASAAWNKYKPDNLRAELVKGCLNARNQLYAHRGLPLECVEYFGAATVNWKGSLTPQVQDRQVCSWLMGSPAVYTGDLASLTQENIARYRNRFDILKRLEKTYGIYRHFQYSGVPTPTDTGWHWWGKLDKRGCGAVVVLRGSQGTNNCSVNIPWVDPAKTYAVAALFQNQPLGLFTGAQLQEGKLNLALPPLGQEILELSPEYKFNDLSAGDHATLSRLVADLNTLEDPNKSVACSFQCDFWCWPMFKLGAERMKIPVAPGTLGIICDPNAPALAGFPTEFHSNWQWWQLVKHSRPVILDATPAGWRPTVQMIDNFARNHKLGLLFETKVGKGKLLLCSIDLPALQDKPEARQLLSSLLAYAGSKDFDPKAELDAAMLRRLSSSD